MKRLGLIAWILWIPFHTLISQSQVSKDNYTGAWESPSSWNPVWETPETINPGQDFIINGHITVNGSLEFFPSPSDLIINDTLVILGDLYLCELSNLTVNSNGILIVRGDLAFETNTHIVTNNYIVVTGDIFAYNIGTGSSFISNTNPVKVFAGGNMRPATITKSDGCKPEVISSRSDSPVANPVMASPL